MTQPHGNPKNTKKLPHSGKQTSRWRVLHVEDNELDRELVRKTLAAEGIAAEFAYASSQADLAAALRAGDYDVILSDFTLPGFNGTAALSNARAVRPDLPFIFVSGTIGEERAVESLKEGAIDYVLKDRLERLVPAMQRALREREERERRRTAEVALHESEQRYRLLFERHPQPMWVYDVETLRFLDVNDTAVERYGYTREEFRAMTILDLRPPEDVPSLRKWLKSKKATAGPPAVWRHRKKDGTLIEVELSAQDLAFAGRSARVVTVNDVTARRQAEAARLSSEQRFATMFRGAPVAIGYGTLDGRIAEVNQQMCDFLGYPCDEMIGRTTLELNIWVNPAECQPLFDRARNGQTIRNQEVKLRRKSGEIRTGLVSLEIIHLASQPVFLVMILDITDRKALEAQLQRANRIESVGRLASGIAHDMNNILAPILMAAPLLRLSLRPAELGKMADTIETSAQRGADLVRQLLMFGRGIEGKRGPVPPGNLIREMTKITGQTFPKNIAIHTHIAPDVWPMRGDASQLHQILLNLCVNARDAMPAGGTLTITAENLRIDEGFAAMQPEAKPGDFVRLTVTDTGHGIPPEIIDRIFDPFFTTKEVGHGTGLGLSTVLAIVKSHGGFLNVRSELNRGTTFEIVLPAIPGGVEAEKPVDGEPLPRGHDELVLVVDDEENIRMVLSEMLGRQNYRVLAAADGAEATAMFARNLDQIQLVITDLDMPFMDGVSLVKVLKRMKPSTKVLVSTGIGSAQTSRNRSAELDALGVKKILSKPYTATEILSAVQDALADA